MGRKIIAGGSAYTVKNRVDHDATITTATDNAVITLPPCAPANKGQRVTIVNSAASGAAKVSISPAAADHILGGVNGASGGSLVSFSGTANKDAINTKATALIGDYLTLVSDGATGGNWYVTGGQGVWASES